MFFVSFDARAALCERCRFQLHVEATVTVGETVVSFRSIRGRSRFDAVFFVVADTQVSKSVVVGHWH